MATYPGGIPNLTNPAGTDYMNGPNLHSVQHTNANDEIEAIAGELGTNPKGTDASVKARLDRMENQSIAWRRGGGTSIPAGAWTRINLGDEINAAPSVAVWDAGAMQFTIQSNGVYIMNGVFSSTSPAGSVTYGRFRVNGISYSSRVNHYNAAATDIEMSHSWVQRVEAGGYIGMDMFCTSAATARYTITADEWIACHLQIIKLGK